MRFSVNGILLLDKSKDATSNFALQKVKRLLNAKKAGHTGSLDPIATGMLPICFGEATKFSQFLLESDKTYRVTAKLGQQTTTADSEGDVIQTSPIPNLSRSQIESVLARFIGEISQIPPMYSAIKHKGKPLYELARRGINIERQPRTVRILVLRLEEMTNDTLTFYVHCTKGTYVRTLIEDITRALDCTGHVIALRRLTVTPYGEATMYTLSALEAILDQFGHQGLIDTLLPVETAVQVFPAVKLTTSAAFYLRMGQPVRAPFLINSPLVRLISENERFIGMGEVLSDGRVKPHRMLAHQDALAAKAG